MFYDLEALNFFLVHLRCSHRYRPCLHEASTPQGEAARVDLEMKATSCAAQYYMLPVMRYAWLRCWMMFKSKRVDHRDRCHNFIAEPLVSFKAEVKVAPLIHHIFFMVSSFLLWVVLPWKISQQAKLDVLSSQWLKSTSLQIHLGSRKSWIRN